MAAPWENYSRVYRLADGPPPARPAPPPNPLESLRPGPWDNYGQTDTRQTMSAPSPTAAPLDTDREPGFMERVGAGIKKTPEGKASYYEGLGYKVATNKEGKLFLFDQAKRQWFPADSPKLTLGDVADLSGDAINIAAEAGLAVLTKGRTSGAAAGGGAGEVLRQGASEALPGSDQMTMGERATDVGTNAALAGVSQGSVNLLAYGVDAIRPHNVGARYVNKAYQETQPKKFIGPPAQKPVAAESARLEKAVGQEYTPGQATGSRGLLTIEGLVRRHPASADKMAEFDQGQLQNSVRYLEQTLGGLSRSPAGAEAVGDRVTRAFDNVVSRATKVRRQTAAVDFGEVDKMAGRYRVVKPTNLLKAVEDIAKEFDVPGGGDASQALVSRIKGIGVDLQRAGPDGMTAGETQRLLQIYGDASRGSGQIFKDMDTAQQRMIAGRLQKAVMADLDVAADGGGHVGKIADSLKTARDNYRQNSKVINDMEQSVLGRLFGGTYDRAPERVAATMRNMKPTELKESFSILSKADPEIAQGVKRMLVEDAMGRAGYATSKNVPAAQVAGNDVFSANRFLTNIRQSQVWDILEKGERASLANSVRDLERVAFRAGTDGSPTAPLLFAWEVAKAFGGGAASLSPTQIAKTAAAVLVPKRVARLITSEKGREALRTMRVTKPGTKAYTAAAAYAITILGEGEQEDVRPSAEVDAASSNVRR